MKKYLIFLLIYIYQIIIQEESIFIRKRCRKKEKGNKKECQNEAHARMKKWKLPLEVQVVYVLGFVYKCKDEGHFHPILLCNARSPSSPFVSSLSVSLLKIVIKVRCKFSQIPKKEEKRKAPWKFSKIRDNRCADLPHISSRYVYQKISILYW